MRKQAREVQYFLYSQAFADGSRTTLAILLPALTGSYLGYFQAGMTMALGALCVSLTDAPGPLLNKRNGMLACALATFVVAAITAFASMSVYTMGAELLFLCFFFSMFNVYGGRAAGVGNAAILVMILTLDKKIPASEVLLHSSLITAGGLFYFVISYLLSALRPYRTAERMLGECIREIAKYLSVRASFYDPSIDLNTNYKKLIEQQITVHEKQEAVREILFKTRQIAEESTNAGRRLVLMFIETVDLFEDITASYYDYGHLRERFAGTGILKKVSLEIEAIARHLDTMGMAVQMNRHFAYSPMLEEQLTRLKADIDAIPRLQSESHLVLRKILVNLRKLLKRYSQLLHYYNSEVINAPTNNIDHDQFVTHQPLDPKIFFSNLTLNSNTFKHALRVSIACVVGYSLSRLFAYGQHSYWVLLTIAFILKPAFSMTKQRNGQRILGTLAGALIGVVILVVFHDKHILFAFMVIFMLLTYSFMRLNYLAMVIFTTPFVLILFSFLGVGFKELAQERLIDTVLGCSIAFLASVILFPSWESTQFNNYVKDMLVANRNYMQMIIAGLGGNQLDVLEYKLVRKQVYVQSANLSAAFQRMLSEPRNTHRNKKSTHEFIVLNHILFSNIATVATTLLSKTPRRHPNQMVTVAKHSLLKLEECIHALGAKEEETKKMQHVQTSRGEEIALPDDQLLSDQLSFIDHLCVDISKAVHVIIDKPLDR